MNPQPLATLNHLHFPLLLPVESQVELELLVEEDDGEEEVADIQFPLIPRSLSVVKDSWNHNENRNKSKSET